MNHFDQTQLAVCPTACPRRTLTHATYRRIAVSVAALHSSPKEPPVQLLPRHKPVLPPKQHCIVAPRRATCACRVGIYK